MEVGSITHQIANDEGFLISIAHSFRKVRAGRDFTIHGCMIPLTGEARAANSRRTATAQFIHKIGNHFQLINLIVGSLRRTGASVDEVEALQLTIDRAVEFTRAFSDYSQTAVFAPGVDVGQTLQAALDSMAPSCAENNVELKNNVAECLGGSIMTGDGYLLELAFGALLQNALEATESGGQIVVGAKKMKRLPEDDPVVLVSVMDNGRGMEKTTLAKAADPFFTSKPDHYGLGLSTACRVIETHGGQVKLSSTLGKGTKVEIMLPVTFSDRPFDR
jgi:signal transduction histidine kinase